MKVKEEKVQKMDDTLKKLRKRVEDQVLDESDLEEFQELLASDIEESQSSDNDDLESQAGRAPVNQGTNIFLVNVQEFNLF